MNYHLSRLRAIQDSLEGHCVGIEFVGGYGDADYDGLPFRSEERDGLNIITLFPHKNLNQVSVFELSQKLIQTLHELSPEQVALCGYHRLENLLALAWAKANRRPTILMSDSKEDDAPRRVLQERLKGFLVRQFDSYLVAGIPHQKYLLSLGAPTQRVFTGYDAVDNTLFAQAAATVRQQQSEMRSRLGLPECYFMAACRFVAKKNLPFLLESYRLYRQTTDTAWSLVICGGGPLETELREIVEENQIPDVYFPGFNTGKELGFYYGLASCFIHPSIQEQWGLVVNEAMAAGLPVLVSRLCGCVPNLIKEGINGFTFDPTNPRELAKLMETMTRNLAQLGCMGTAAKETIAEYSPEAFAANLILAMNAAR
jgi:glycosyltransferase involved in cell wall biosynthesis